MKLTKDKVEMEKAEEGNERHGPCFQRVQAGHFQKAPPLKQENFLSPFGSHRHGLLI